jgi:ABC-type nitrate/sulfonate/bicarbonate transport system permease component
MMASIIVVIILGVLLTLLLAWLEKRSDSWRGSDQRS